VAFAGRIRYADLPEVLADPEHERHREMLEWSGGALDPAAADEPAIRKRLDALAARLTRRTAPRPAAARQKVRKP